MTVRDHERDHLMADIDEIVCLKRSYFPTAADRQAIVTSAHSAKPDRAPPLKRKRLALGSTALTDML